MISWKKPDDKVKYNRVIEFSKEIIKGLGIDLSKPFTLEGIKLTNDVQDFDILNERLLLLSRVSYYLAIIQGDTLTLQREYKYPVFYGMNERISDLTRAVRMETDILRTILSTAREQIKLK